MKLRRTYRDGQVVATSELGNLAGVAERSAHDNGVVAELLVVVEDALHGLDAGVGAGGISLSRLGLVPVEDTANEGRDQVGTGLSGCNGLGKREQEGQVGVDAVVTLEDLGSLDTLPGGGNLDQDALLVDTLLLVELYIMLAPGKPFKTSY